MHSTLVYRHTGGAFWSVWSGKRQLGSVRRMPSGEWLAVSLPAVRLGRFEAKEAAGQALLSGQSAGVPG